MINFNEMNLKPEIIMALEDMGFENPMPIQEEVIPLVSSNLDVIAQAPTGTGKTCAFGIPVVNSVNLETEDVQVLILCPTRELVIQTENELKEVATYCKGIKILSIYGGQNIDRQLAGLRKKPQIIIGTTGRVMDHLRRRTLKLTTLKVLVLDEVDEMLDMGFREDIDIILETAPKQRQTLLFSATMPKEIIEISKRYQTDPVSVKTQHEESDIPNINQYYVSVEEAKKIDMLVEILKEKKYFLALVFCNTKKRVDELSSHLSSLGLNCDALHGDLRQHNRDKTMKKFRSGETQILVATDVAARGIDVNNIEAVFNFDVPHDEEYYVHRIGRTARANKDGDAYTFVSEKQSYVIKNFERYTKNVILKADFLKESQEISIDRKLFDKTLQLAKRGGVDAVKAFVETELETLRQKNSKIELLDITAALLLQLNDGDKVKTVTLSAPPKLAMKEGRGRGRQAGVKFFMNIGSRDKCDADSIAKFISLKANISPDKILGVNCLENYSFATVTDGLNDEMTSLNGMKFNKRILAVEEASNDRERKPAKKAAQSSTEIQNKPAPSAKPLRNFDKTKNSSYPKRDYKPTDDFSSSKPKSRSKNGTDNVRDISDGSASPKRKGYVAFNKKEKNTSSGRKN